MLFQRASLFSEHFLMELHHLSYWYRKKQSPILSNINLSIGHKDCITITGASGIGKSTLLYLLAGLLKPRKGKIFWGLHNYKTDASLSFFRSRHIGFIFQDYRLFNDMTVQENIQLAQFFSHHNRLSDTHWIKEIAGRLGIADLLQQKPHFLSGGERQRVAIARALIGRPSLILADEPTGNLDIENRARVKNILLDFQSEWGASLILVTHDPVMAQIGRNQYELQAGQLLRVSRTIA